MQPLFAYLLKLAFCLALGYFFYFLLLRRMTYYTWNRYFLLFFSLAAPAIPLLPIQLPQNVQHLNVVFFITEALPSLNQALPANATQQAWQWNIYNMALLGMVTGMFFFLVRFAIRFYSLHKTRSAATLVNNGDVKLYHLAGCTAPFSFYNSIYLDTNKYNEPELENIVEHELVHITEKHTMDMLVSELLCIVQWFNPFIWLMKHAIKQNLEFIADDSVLQKGINRKGYQYLLLKVSGAVPYSLANNLLFPSLKKRIHMMNRKKTGKMHLLKFICIVPLGCVLLFSFSGPAGTPPAGGNHTDAFSLASLSFYINDAGVAALVKNDQPNSFLKTGAPLSLSLLSEEKTRLQALLVKNGYHNLDDHTISFVMDSSATKHSFSVQVTIRIDQSKKLFSQPDKNRGDNTAIKRTADAADIRYAVASLKKTEQHTILPAQNSPVHKQVAAGPVGKQ